MMSTVVYWKLVLLYSAGSNISVFVFFFPRHFVQLQRRRPLQLVHHALPSCFLQVRETKGENSLPFIHYCVLVCFLPCLQAVGLFSPFHSSFSVFPDWWFTFWIGYNFVGSLQCFIFLNTYTYIFIEEMMVIFLN